MCSTRAPASRAACTAAWLGASTPPARATSCSGVRGRTRLRRRLTSGPGSSSSWPSVSIESVAADSASRQANTVSIASEGRPPERWRRSSNTSSMLCVSSATLAKPMVALMPLNEWAMRKISSTVA